MGYLTWAKFAKAISADEVYSTHIGENAKNNLKAGGIKFQILDQEQIKKIIEDGEKQ